MIADICKSIFWFMKSYPLLLTVDSRWLWENKISCFLKRDLIELNISTTIQA